MNEIPPNIIANIENFQKHRPFSVFKWPFYYHFLATTIQNKINPSNAAKCTRYRQPKRKMAHIRGFVRCANSPLPLFLHNSIMPNSSTILTKMTNLSELSADFVKPPVDLTKKYSVRIEQNFHLNIFTRSAWSYFHHYRFFSVQLFVYNPLVSDDYLRQLGGDVLINSNLKTDKDEVDMAASTIKWNFVQRTDLLKWLVV